MVRRLDLSGADGYRFLFAEISYTLRDVNNAVATAMSEATPLVLVIDDLARVTSPRLAWIRELARREVRLVVIVDASVAGERLARLRAALRSAPLRQPWTDKIYCENTAACCDQVAAQL